MRDAKRSICVRLSQAYWRCEAQAEYPERLPSVDTLPSENPALSSRGTWDGFGVPPPLAPYYLGRRVGSEFEVVLVEAPLPGRTSMRRCLLLSMDQTSEGHYRPRRSWFGYGKLGFRPKSLVAYDTRVVTVSDYINVLFLPRCGPTFCVVLAGVHLLDKES